MSTHCLSISFQSIQFSYASRKHNVESHKLAEQRERERDREIHMEDICCLIAISLRKSLCNNPTVSCCSMITFIAVAQSCRLHLNYGYFTKFSIHTERGRERERGRENEWQSERENKEQKAVCTNPLNIFATLLHQTTTTHTPIHLPSTHVRIQPPSIQN